MTPDLDLLTALTNLREQESRAASQFYDELEYHEESADPSWHIETCYIQLLVVLEAFNLPALRSMVDADYQSAKGSDKGFLKAAVDFSGPYSVELSKINRWLSALEILLPNDKHTAVTKNLLDIIRNIHYVITDRSVFDSVPQNERDVHLRTEAVLRSVFRGLLHKPRLSKPIKSFEPDTGIRSLRTLIEYKFLARRGDIARVADEILADTRGYTSKEWRRFLYVIYETHRFRKEEEWNQLLRESGVPRNTTAVVLSGEPGGASKAPEENKKAKAAR